MRAGLSTGCFYPQLIEENIRLVSSANIPLIEMFICTESELLPEFLKPLKKILDDGGVKCNSVHPFTSVIEPLLLYSPYERRVDDFLEFHKRYFQAMNLLGAEIFVHHGNLSKLEVSDELYFERYLRLVETGKEFGITVAQENISRCNSASLQFKKHMMQVLGDNAVFVYDVKQAHIYGENVYEAIEALHSNIVHIHISDSARGSACRLIGEGYWDVKKFLRKLKSYNYSGDIILEVYNHNFESSEMLFDNFWLLDKMVKEVNMGE